MAVWAPTKTLLNNNQLSLIFWAYLSHQKLLF